MRPTSVMAFGALIVIGIILADFIAHPQGTASAGNALVGVVKPTINGLLGKSS